ncbi:unnamed protein product, partial [Owenia fusiformis]
DPKKTTEKDTKKTDKDIKQTTDPKKTTEKDKNTTDKNIKKTANDTKKPTDKDSKRVSDETVKPTDHDIKKTYEEKAKTTSKQGKRVVKDKSSQDKKVESEIEEVEEMDSRTVVVEGASSKPHNKRVRKAPKSKKYVVDSSDEEDVKLNQQPRVELQRLRDEETDEYEDYQRGTIRNPIKMEIRFRYFARDGSVIEDETLVSRYSDLKI